MAILKTYNTNTNKPARNHIYVIPGAQIQDSSYQDCFPFRAPIILLILLLPPKKIFS